MAITRPSHAHLEQRHQSRVDRHRRLHGQVARHHRGEDDHTLEQMTKQLDKLVNVLQVLDLSRRPAVERELMLLKVSATAENRAGILDLVQVFRAKVVDVSYDALTLEVVGDPGKLVALDTTKNLLDRIKTKLITFALQGAYFRPISNDNLLKRIVTVPAKRANASKALRSMCIGMSNRPNSIKGPSIIANIKKLPNRPPILLIWGKQDKLIPIFLAKKLIKLHPWLKLTVVNEAGHCPHDELPIHFNQIVMKWLKNLKTSK